MNIIERYESEVRSYSRGFPVVFTKAKGAILTDRDGREYIDFFAGAGALNYGHNDEALKQKLIDYIAGDNITHSLDMATEARERFLEAFHDIILEPRGMDYKVMFPGPTGTNCVEAALKLARKVTGRRTIVSFTNAFHGMTLGSLAVTGNAFKRKGAGKALDDTVFMPFDRFMGEGVDTLDHFENMLTCSSSGLDHPAAVIVETVQGEGGINAAGMDWLKRLQSICRAHDIKLIVDDVQAGCGRTGTFFSFEPAGLDPDFICLSKSIGGYGLPMAITLIKPEFDKFAPGEHNGTFRGNNPAFVTATAALETYWRDDKFACSVREKGETIRARLEEMAAAHPELKPEVRGRGFMQGLALHVDGAAEDVSAAAFERGLIMETSGANDEVAKLLPPLILSEDELRRGLDIMADAVAAVARKREGGEKRVA
ncbi:diaminobutyrate--2-oxoglutarate transaminase [Ferruginivarius sediminum]|uniref:Diaminobutyrate--2-oxoglutarate transaminase n=1 Tax=Ferruginivarius sediminum TaxID=2661937 RepID=A0A369TH52_9PROT|nr:diaminobutyrate--2-oxoglutarate transaminase [Ferruginivarius sediminum]RDD63705.1 diaminobutyrate--2-oxoglutarate transaminase [Ferruginivarius sediminum]